MKQIFSDILCSFQQFFTKELNIKLSGNSSPKNELGKIKFQS